jgi:CheY-like chemotaxis protein
MEGKMISGFILIDDDPINNMICEQVIQEVLPEAEILSFTDPETGLSHIHSVYEVPAASNAIIYLDINMPTLSGWEVLDKFNAFPPSVKENVRIFMLSSSIDPQDKQRANENPSVNGYIEKPLTMMQVQKTIEDVNITTT